MSLIATARATESPDVITTLQSVCDEQGLLDLAGRLADLSDLVRWDLANLEQSLDELSGDDVVRRGGLHLLNRPGKRLRPMCLALGARVGSGFGAAARQLAVAVELVHCATLLHDDVVDLGEERRGAQTTRAIYGNAASIFAGDWFLVEALRRVHEANVPGGLSSLLEVIDEMIGAEAVQLETRGRLETNPARYFQIVEGKTASLFRWALGIGGRAGGLGEDDCAALADYGQNLGVAFQLIDDLLDYVGSSARTGKGLFADLREGKITYPLIAGMQRDSSVKALLEEILALPPHATPRPRVALELKRVLEASGAVTECRALAERRARDATQGIEHLPDSRAKQALLTVALATVHREH